MLIKMLKDWERTKGIVRAGKEIEVPPALARSLIAKRMATAVKRKKDDFKTAAAEATAAKVSEAERAAAKAAAKAAKSGKAGKAAEG